VGALREDRVVCERGRFTSEKIERVGKVAKWGGCQGPVGVVRQDGGVGVNA